MNLKRMRHLKQLRHHPNNNDVTNAEIITAPSTGTVRDLA